MSSKLYGSADRDRMAQVIYAESCSSHINLARKASNRQRSIQRFRLCSIVTIRFVDCSRVCREHRIVRAIQGDRLLPLLSSQLRGRHRRFKHQICLAYLSHFKRPTSLLSSINRLSRLLHSQAQKNSPLCSARRRPSNLAGLASDRTVANLAQECQLLLTVSRVIGQKAGVVPKSPNKCSSKIWQ